MTLYDRPALPEARRDRTCPICDRTIRIFDIAVIGTHDGEHRQYHLACTAEGVKRWNREGRPCGDPLEADRHLRWKWDPNDFSRTVVIDREHADRISYPGLEMGDRHHYLPGRYGPEAETAGDGGE